MTTCIFVAAGINNSGAQISVFFAAEEVVEYAHFGFQYEIKIRRTSAGDARKEYQSLQSGNLTNCHSDRLTQDV